MPRGKNKGRGGRFTHAIQQNTAIHAASHKKNQNIAQPTIQELPLQLQLQFTSSCVPPQIQDAFPEFNQLNPFFTSLERIHPEFGGSSTQYHKSWFGISSSDLSCIEFPKHDDRFHCNLVLHNGSVLPTFVKRIHLLDPIRTMEGDYVIPDNGALPAPSQLWKHTFAKVNDPFNEAYVDALYASIASRMVENNISPHWCKCYGTFNSRVAKYMYNITEEYETLVNKPWWRRNQKNGLFSLYKECSEEQIAASKSFLTEGLVDIVNSDYDSLDTDNISDMNIRRDEQVSAPEDQFVVEEHDVESHNDSSPIHLTTPKLSLKRMKNASDIESDSYSEGTLLEEKHHVLFQNFPVQVTLLEQLDGTMDELIEEEDDDDETLCSTKDDRWTAWMFQVICALTAAQHMTGFVHNDLHTNNIMWSGTGQTHLHYRIHKGKETYYMSVPTYGRIMKIIDFGRASYTLPSYGGFFISDAFYPNNDAATQYNCEPFFQPQEGKKVCPNPSFDLCRLSVSLIESLYPNRPPNRKPIKIMSREGNTTYAQTESSLYNMLWEWMIDDEGKNILVLPDGKERYPNFDLYRAIASDIHHAIPKNQIERPLFATFKIDSKMLPKDEHIYDLYL